jgi:prepilin-type N-terminal cleavage/methylation domain-containing protein
VADRGGPEEKGAPGPASAGFSLIEIVVALALLGLLAGAAAAVSVRVIRGNLQERTVLRMRALLTAMIGNPDRSDHGYMGDMGGLPDTSLTQLFLRGSQRPAVADATDGIISGYNGPYILEGADPTRGFVDFWNSAIVYTPGIAQLTSLGPDRTLGTADDIVYPSVAPVLSGTITVLVRGQLNSGGPPIALRSDEASVQVYYTRTSDHTRAAASVLYSGSQGSGIWITASPVHLGDHGVLVTGLDGTATGGRNFSGSVARDIVTVNRGSAYVTVLLNEAG